MRSLVIEDEAVSRRMLKAYLDTHGACEAAEDGFKGIEAVAKAFADNQPYDLICLDIVMPGMDGQEVLSRIRELERTAGISKEGRAKILMTSVVLDEESVLKKISEWDGYLTKPFEKGDVEDHLRDFGLI